jgi:hypothetical protein
MFKKTPRIVLWILLMMLMAGVLWAGAELLGESNKAAADAGSNAADTEMASLDSVKPPKAKAAPSRERSLAGKVRQADKRYTALLDKAKSEINSQGSVGDVTRDAGLKAANVYKTACDDYARYWDGKNLASRAGVYREAGNSRIASAEMAFNNIDSGKVDAASAAQDKFRDAYKAYLADAKTDLTDAERAAVKSSLSSRLQQVAGNVQTLVGKVADLLRQVQAGASPTAAVGCAAKSVAAGGSPSDDAAALLMPLKSLLSLVQGMAGNISGMISDVNTL